MGAFDGILICSDFDGTMAHHAQVSKETCEAIAYFQREGGIFCPCSGREPSFFHKYFDQFRPNGPVITLNGSAILEYGETPEEDRLLYVGVTPHALSIAYAREMLTLPGIEYVSLFQIDRPYTVCPPGKEPPDALLEYKAELDALTGDFQKIVTTHDIVHLDAIRAHMEPRYGDRLTFGSSWEKGYEAQLIGTDKGSAALRVKEMVGAHTLVCVGNYDNDLSMLLVADISYAVGDAVDSLKAVAHRITVPCAEHAIAKIVADLENDVS